MIRIPQLKLHIHHTEQELKQAIQKELRLSSTTFSYMIRKRSIDARKKQEIHFVYVIDVLLTKKEEEKILTKSKGKVLLAPNEEYSFTPYGTKSLIYRPVIIGAGPAGLFCGYFLAKHGFSPIILERGEPMEQRIQRVEQFWQDYYSK